MSSCKAHTNILCCPVCKGPIKTVNEKTIGCSLHGEFPVRNGIPSFCSSSGDFDQHWHANTLAGIPEQKRKVAKSFLAPLRAHLHGVQNPIVLDGGCGDGVHAVVLPQVMDRTDAIYVGTDISYQVLDAAPARSPAQSQLVHADLHALPFRDDTFDAVFSFGVLAYLSRPRKGLSELCRVLKPGGVIGIWALPRQRGLVGLVVRGLRLFCRLTGRPGAWLAANCVVPFLGLVSTKSGLSLKNATWRQCREVVMVDIAPDVLHFPSLAEWVAWINEAGADVVSTAGDPITIWGRKHG